MSSKRGRKRDDNLPPNRARDVQRAFRARRASHLEALEQRVITLEDENARLRGALSLPPSDRSPIGTGPTGRGKAIHSISPLGFSSSRSIDYLDRRGSASLSPSLERYPYSSPESPSPDLAPQDLRPSSSWSYSSWRGNTDPQDVDISHVHRTQTPAHNPSDELQSYHPGSTDPFPASESPTPSTSSANARIHVEYPSRAQDQFPPREHYADHRSVAQLPSSIYHNSAQPTPSYPNAMYNSSVQEDVKPFQRALNQNQEAFPQISSPPLIYTHHTSFGTTLPPLSLPSPAPHTPYGATPPNHDYPSYSQLPPPQNLGAQPPNSQPHYQYDMIVMDEEPHRSQYRSLNHNENSRPRDSDDGTSHPDAPLFSRPLTYQRPHMYNSHADERPFFLPPVIPTFGSRPRESEGGLITLPSLQSGLGVRGT